MADAAATGENSNSESVLKFEHADLYTEPYDLRRFFFLYTGSALTATGYLSFPLSAYLYVPPNVAAVVTLGNGTRVTLKPGRHALAGALKAHPVSVQFVNTRRQSFAFSMTVKSWGQLELEIELRLTLAVAAPDRVTEWKDPLADVRTALTQSVARVAANNAYEDSLRKMPDLLHRDVRPVLEQSCGPRGLAVAEILVSRLTPDKQYVELERNNLLDIRRMLTEIEKHEREKDAARQITALKEEQAQLEHNLKIKEIELREQRVDRDRAIRLRELQAEEDLFAMQQPGFRRKIMGDINAQLRTFNQEARLKAIESIGELAKTLLEETRAHPGRLHSEQEAQVLQKALDLLDRLAQPVSPPPIPQQVRSHLAVDKAGPPGPPDKPPLVVPPPPVALPISFEDSPLGAKTR